MSLKRNRLHAHDSNSSICDSSCQKAIDASPKNNGMRLRSRRLKRSSLTNDTRIIPQKLNYESPLKHFGRKSTRCLKDSARCSKDSAVSIGSPRSETLRSKKRKRSSSLTENVVSLHDSVIILSDNEVQSSNKSRMECLRNEIAPFSKDRSYVFKSIRTKIDSSDRLDVISLLTPEKDSCKEIRNLDDCTENQCKVEKSLDTITIAKSENNANEMQEQGTSTSQGQISSWVSKLELDDQNQQVIAIDSEDENTEPSKESSVQREDISVIWMSLKKPSLRNSSVEKTSVIKNIKDHKNTRIKKRELIIIDKKGNSSNMYNLNSESKVITRKRRVRRPKRLSRQNKNIKSSSNTNITGKKICSLDRLGLTVNLNKKCSESKDTEPSGKLREIVIDGSNIAMAHSNGKTFSEMGLTLVIDFFKQRGHSVKVFVPQYRRSIHHQLLEKLYTEGTVVFTPSRQIGGRMITPYDDRFILDYATMCNGIVVSQDQYRDLYLEKPEWRDTIENRLLAPTFVGNYVMFPEDPLGKTGPRLDEFLRH